MSHDPSVAGRRLRRLTGPAGPPPMPASLPSATGGWVPEVVRAAAGEYAWAHPAPGEDDEPTVGGVRPAPPTRRVRWAVPWRVAATAATAVGLVAGAAVLHSVALTPEAVIDLPEPSPPDGTGTATASAEVAAPGLTAAAAAGGAAPTAQPGVVVVHVVGAVAAPGVQRLPAGSRVVDAVDAAGGATADADLARVNLARVLVDGEQVVVPRPGDPAPTAASQATTGAAGDEAVDLNTASLAELDTLPGVGPVLAQRIVDGRPYTSVDELDEVSGIGPTLLERLRSLVRV